MRVACLRVAELPLAAELRAQPELAGTPLAIASGPGPRAELIAVSAAAARRGVQSGSSAAQARAVCAALVVRIASPALERAAREALLDAALSAAPRAAPVARASGALGAEAAVHVDAGGVATLHGSEAGFAGALIERARRVGLPAVAAVASSRAVALLAARTLREPGAALVVPADTEAAFLAPLAIDLLDPEDALAEALTRFGVRSLGELARLPRRALAARLPPEALRLAALARGEAEPEPLPAPAARSVEEAADLEVAVERLEPLAFVLRGLLARVTARLALRGLACGDFELSLALAGGGRDVRRVGVAAPTGDVRVLLRLACLALEAHPPGAAVEGVGITSEGRPPRRDQLDLFRPAGPAPAVLDRVLAELEALCGPGRVGAPAPANSHHPDAYLLTSMNPVLPEARRPAASSPRTPQAAPKGAARSEAKPSEDRKDRRASCAASSCEPTSKPALALRVLRPPSPAQVRVRGGRPEWLESPVARGAIVAMAGPWRTSGGWWSAEERFALDQFDVQTEDGGVLRLRFDRLSRRWFVDGIYD